MSTLDSSRNWFAAYTYPRHEKKVVTMLKHFDVECFLPTFSAVRRWNNRKAQVQFPLFPQYVFLNIASDQRAKVLGVPGLVSLVGSKGKASPLPAEQMDALRRSLDVRKAEPHPFLAIGKPVRVRNGPLTGLEGVVLRHKGDMRMIISLEMIQQSISVELEQADLEAAA